MRRLPVCTTVLGLISVLTDFEVFLGRLMEAFPEIAACPIQIRAPLTAPRFGRIDGSLFVQCHVRSRREKAPNEAADRRRNTPPRARQQMMTLVFLLCDVDE